MAQVTQIWPKHPKMALQNGAKWSKIFMQNGPNEASNTNANFPDQNWGNVT